MSISEAFRRVVVDTCIVKYGIEKTHIQAVGMIGLVLNHEVQAYANEDLFYEYRNILGRIAEPLYQEKIKMFLGEIYTVEPKQSLKLDKKIVEDLDDLRLIEAALCCDGVIVTCDHHLLDAKEKLQKIGIKVLHPRSYV